MLITYCLLLLIYQCLFHSKKLIICTRQSDISCKPKQLIE